jgi:hypothetical protein
LIKAILETRRPRLVLVAAAVIAITLAAAIFALHHGSSGSEPAGQDQNLKAYKKMIISDYTMSMDALNATFNASNQCNTVQNTGCPDALTAMVPHWQMWLNDLNSYQTPSRYVVIDGQLRRHLTEKIAELNAAVAFQRERNERGFSLAVEASSYEITWSAVTVAAVEGTYVKVAGSYHDAVNLAKEALDACIHSAPGSRKAGCDALSHETCTGAAAENCAHDVENAETQLQTFVVALLQDPAPSALAKQGAQLQAHLVQADIALLAIADALLRGDSAKVAAGQGSYKAAITAADADASP